MSSEPLLLKLHTVTAVPTAVLDKPLQDSTVGRDLISELQCCACIRSFFVRSPDQGLDTETGPLVCDSPMLTLSHGVSGQHQLCYHQI